MLRVSELRTHAFAKSAVLRSLDWLSTTGDNLFFHLWSPVGLFQKAIKKPHQFLLVTCCNHFTTTCLTFSPAPLKSWRYIIRLLLQFVRIGVHVCM